MGIFCFSDSLPLCFAIVFVLFYVCLANKLSLSLSKPYLLYGADVINWDNLDLSSIRHPFNSAMCRIYKVKFRLLDSTLYDITNQGPKLQNIYEL